GIAAGSDGNVWFTEAIGKIGRITPAGVITEFDTTPFGEPGRITAGSDGNLWFTVGGKIGQITPAGVIQVFPVPHGIGLNAIVAGLDGNVWFTETDDNNYWYVGRITPTGVVREFSSSPFKINDLTAGPDGNLWSVPSSSLPPYGGTDDSITRVTPAGVISR